MTSDGLRDFDYDEADRLAKVRILQGGEAASVTYLTNGLGQRVFKGEPVAEQTLPDEETLGLDFIAWLKSKFRWMFENAQATASVGTSYAYAEGLPPWVLLGEYDNGSATGTGRTRNTSGCRSPTATSCRSPCTATASSTASTRTTWAPRGWSRTTRTRRCGSGRTARSATTGRWGC